MAKLNLPIRINLPDDWIEQIVNRLRNDPEAEWVEITRCKDCKYWKDNKHWTYCDRLFRMGIADAYDYMTEKNDYCGWAERQENGKTN